MVEDFRFAIAQVPGLEFTRNPKFGLIQNHPWAGHMNESDTAGQGITKMLGALSQGDVQEVEELFAVLYAELRRLAAGKMAKEIPGQTLQPTALVHEAWLRLARGQSSHWENRAHFFAAAGEAMRRILVENARRKRRLKRGGQLQRIQIEDAFELASPMPDDDLLALDEALQKLIEIDPRAGAVVNLCFFVGLTQEQVAKELNLSISTVERTWAFARAWLFREIQRERTASA